jgi:hypothetical protein
MASGRYHLPTPSTGTGMGFLRGIKVPRTNPAAIRDCALDSGQPSATDVDSNSDCDHSGELFLLVRHTTHEHAFHPLIFCSLLSYAIRRSTALYLYRPMTLETLGATVTISMRSLVFHRRSWKWPLVSVLFLVVAGIQTSGHVVFLSLSSTQPN